MAEDPWFSLWGGTQPQPHSGADDPDPCRVLPLPLGPCHGNPEGSLQLLGASSPGLLKRFGADIKELSCQVLRSAGRKDAAKAKPGGGGRSLILLPAPNSWGGPRSPGAWQQEKGEKPLGMGHGPGTSVFRASFVRFEANWRKKKNLPAKRVRCQHQRLRFPCQAGCFCGSVCGLRRGARTGVLLGAWRGRAGLAFTFFFVAFFWGHQDVTLVGYVSRRLCRR